MSDATIRNVSFIRCYQTEALDGHLRVTSKKLTLWAYISVVIDRDIHLSVSVIACRLLRFENCPDFQFQTTESFDAHLPYVCNAILSAALQMQR